jgi:hypothetical protein
MNYIFNVIANGVKYTLYLILIMVFIFLSFMLSLVLFTWYINLWAVTPPQYYIFLIIIPIILMIGLISTGLKSLFNTIFPSKPDYSKINVDKMVLEIRKELQKENLL